MEKHELKVQAEVCVEGELLASEVVSIDVSEGITPTSITAIEAEIKEIVAKIDIADDGDIDLTKFDPLINKLINRKVYNYQSSDMCMEREDLFQMGRIWLWEAHHKYDPSSSRGKMQKKSFIHMYLDSRFGNLRNKVTRKNSFGTITLSDLAGWAVTGGQSESGEEQKSSGYSGMIDIVSKLKCSEQAAIERIDVQTVLDRLKGLNQIVFVEYYMHGLNIKEIAEKYPSVGYHRIRKSLRTVQKIRQTLCEGDIV